MKRLNQRALIACRANSLKQARELAKGVSDNELKQQIGEAYEMLLDLREHVLTLDEENRQLKAQLAAKAAYVGPVPPHGYFYAAEDGQRQHPICPLSFQAKEQRIGFMTDAHSWNHGIRRECKACGHIIYEKAMDFSQTGSIRPMVRRS